MAIRSSLYFIFDGEKSDNYSIYNVNISSSDMQSEAFAAQRTIKEQVIRNRDRPYYFGMQLSPLEFTVSFAFKNSWNSELIRGVARWLLSPKYYAPLQFSDNLDTIYYAICVDSPELIHNCLREGYINLKFRCDGAYAYSPLFNSTVLDYSNNSASGTEYIFENLGDVECRPMLTLQKIGNGDISIVNKSNYGQEFKITGLLDKENLAIDFEEETIETDIALTSRYDNHNGIFLSMSPKSKNYLQVYGNCKLRWNYQFRLLQQ